MQGEKVTVNQISDIFNFNILRVREIDCQPFMNIKQRGAD